MGIFEDNAALLGQVDDVLGDSITYLVGGVPLERSPGDPTIPGFINLLGDPGGYDGVRPTQRRWSCKIHKRFLPDGPALSHRVQHPKLGGVTYRPAADSEADDGDSWFFDLQVA